MDFPFSSRFTLASTITNSYKSQLAEGKEVALLEQRNQWQKSKILKRKKYATGFLPVIQEIETWPKQNPLEGTGMEIREAPGKSEWIIKSGLFCVTSSTDQYGDSSDSSSFVQEIETWPKQQNPLEGTGMEIREAPGKSESSIKSGLLCVTSSADQYGDSSDSSSFVQEIETWPKQQNPLEETGMESRKAPGKSEWINSISMSLTVTQPEQKQPSAKRNRTRINGMRQGKRQDDSDMKNSMALHQAIVESELMVTVDGSSDELRQRCDDFIAQFRNQAIVESELMVTVDGSSDELRQRCDDFIARFRNQIHFQNSGTKG